MTKTAEEMAKIIDPYNTFLDECEEVVEKRFGVCSVKRCYSKGLYYVDLDKCYCTNHKDKFVNILREK